MADGTNIWSGSVHRVKPRWRTAGRRGWIRVIFLFTYGARLLPAIETALIGAVDAPLAPFWVWLAFGETPSTGTIIGGSIVFTAVAVHLIVGETRALEAPAVAGD